MTTTTSRWHLCSGGAHGSDVQWVDTVYTFLGADRVASVNIFSFPGHNAVMGRAPCARRVFCDDPGDRKVHRDLAHRAACRTLPQQVLLGRGTYTNELIMRDAALACQTCDILLVCGKLNKASRGVVSSSLVRDCLGGTGNTLRMIADWHASRRIPICFVEAAHTPAAARCWVGTLHQKRVEGLHQLHPSGRRLSDVLDIISRDGDSGNDVHVTMIGTRDLPSSSFIESVFTDSSARPTRVPTG